MGGMNVNQIAMCIGMGRLTGQDLSVDELRRRGLEPAEVRMVELFQNLSLLRDRTLLSPKVEGPVRIDAIWNVLVGKDAEGKSLD
jgi:hypothetical protein